MICKSRCKNNLYKQCSFNSINNSFYCKKHQNSIYNINKPLFTDLEINKLVTRVEELGFNIKVMKSTKDFLVDAGYDEEYGARPLNRAIQKFIEDPVSEEILKGNVSEGQSIMVSYSKVKEKIEVKIV